MHSLLRIPYCMAVVVGLVHAQDVAAPAPLPPAMRSAIDRLTNRTVAEERNFRFETPQSKSPFLMPRSSEVIARSTAAETCSVPLKEMHAENPERFTMLVVPPPANEDRMPRARMPAPPCEPIGR